MTKPRREIVLAVHGFFRGPLTKKQEQEVEDLLTLMKERRMSCANWDKPLLAGTAAKLGLNPNRAWYECSTGQHVAHRKC